MAGQGACSTRNARGPAGRPSAVIEISNQPVSHPGASPGAKHLVAPALGPAASREDVPTGTWGRRFGTLPTVRDVRSASCVVGPRRRQAVRRGENRNLPPEVWNEDPNW